MARNSLIIEGLTSQQPVIIVEGLVDSGANEVLSTGTIIISGKAATSRFPIVLYSSGGIIVKGEAIKAIEIARVGAGEIVVSGVAQTSIEFVYNSQGQIIVGGEAQTEPQLTQFIGTGSIIVGGKVSVLRDDFGEIAAGQITINGSAQSSVEINPIEYSGSGAIIITGNGDGRPVISEFIHITPTVEIPDAARNYFSDTFTNPKITKEIKGGISHLPRTQKVLASNSRELIKGGISHLPRTQKVLASNSRKLIKGGKSNIIEGQTNYFDIYTKNKELVNSGKISHLSKDEKILNNYSRKLTKGKKSHIVKKNKIFS